MGQPPYQPDPPQWQPPQQPPDPPQWQPQQPPQQPPPQRPPPQQPPAQPQWQPTPASGEWGPAQQHWPGQDQQHWPGQDQQWQNPPPPQPQQWQQPAPPVLPGPTFGTHLKRAFDWNVAKIVTAPREEQQLEAAGVERRLHGLYAWRRSTLLVALPVLLLSVVLNFVQAGQNDTSGLTGFGKLLNWLPAIALVFVPIGALIVLGNWTEIRRSSKRLLICWIISIAIPLFVALIPLDFLVDIGTRRQVILNNGGDVRTFDAQVLLTRLGLAVKFALILLPVVLSIPGGVLKGAGRIKSLFPSASLPGWFIVAVAPFYSLFMIVVFVLIDQILGDAVLLVGIALLALAPWLFVIHRNVYGRPLSVAESDGELTRASRWGGWLTLGGIVFLAIFMIEGKVGQEHVVSGDSDKSFFTYVDVLRTVGEVLARGMVTAVVFSTIFLFLVYAEWRMMTQFTGDIKTEHDAQISALERYMVSRAAPFDPSDYPAQWPDAPEQATWTGPPTS
ncbi:MAG: hypothetical protein QOH89_1794 [Pseudonocardiales bacterium]|nr:hypothetical protein [Pseudonocardiales bacterium]